MLKTELESRLDRETSPKCYDVLKEQMCGFCSTNGDHFKDGILVICQSLCYQIYDNCVNVTGKDGKPMLNENFKREQCDSQYPKENCYNSYSAAGRITISFFILASLFALIVI